MRLDFNLDDLTNSALKRLVQQLLTADDAEEKKIMSNLKKRAQSPKNDLADLVEETRGKSPAPKVEDDDLPMEPDDDGDDFPEVPVAKKGKK